MNGLGELLTQLTGIELSRGGLRFSLERHAEQRASELGLASRDDYYQRVVRGNDGEREQLFDVIGVPHTWFFRDGLQLSAASQVLGERANEGGPISIWVPGCATGEDAYSLAMITRELRCPARITATDISNRSLDRARAATYSAYSLRELPTSYSKHFRKEGNTWIVSDEIRARVRFQWHNLMQEPLAEKNGWDLILCRNVLIYFSAATSAACAERLGRTLHPRGTLFLGPGELIQHPPTGLEPVMVGQRVAFRRTGSSSSLRLKPMPAQKTNLPTPPVRASLGNAPTPAQAPLPPTAPSFGNTPPPLAKPTGGAMRSRLFQQADITSAASDILEASAHDPLDPELRMLAGIALYTARDYPASLSELRAALLLDDRLWPAALYQGLCLDSMGAPLRARTEYRHAARLLESGAAARVPLPPALQGLAGDLLAMVQKKAKAL